MLSSGWTREIQCFDGVNHNFVSFILDSAPETRSIRKRLENCRIPLSQGSGLHVPLLLLQLYSRKLLEFYIIIRNNFTSRYIL